MLETSSVHIFSVSLNVEWAVDPPSKSVAAMPDEAAARAIFLSNLTFANSKFIKNILLVPPTGASKIFSLHYY